MMKRPGRNLLVLMRNEFMSEQAIEQEVECLNRILLKVETDKCFSYVNELLDRNRITSNREKIMKESKFIRLRPFRFLINKN